MITKTTSFISPPHQEKNQEVSDAMIESQPEQSNNNDGCTRRFSKWCVANRNKLLVGTGTFAVVCGLAGAGYTLASHLQNGFRGINETALMSRSINITTPSAATSSKAPNIEQWTMDLIQEATSESPKFLTDLKIEETPDWYKSITSSTNENNELDQSKTHTETSTDQNEATTQNTYPISTVRPNSPNPINRPFAEYEETGYLIFSDSMRMIDQDTYHQIQVIKETLARELPKNVKLIIYTSSNDPSDIQRINKIYTPLVGTERLDILKVNPALNKFWTRDSVPLPVYDDSGALRLIGARYYRFEQDQLFANHFNIPLETIQNYFEGGNFIADNRGNCVVIDDGFDSLPTDITFTNTYRCRNVTRLEHLTGIGHIDEVVKFISPNEVLTDQPAYVERLEALNYNVSVLPQPSEKFATYLNSLIINNNVFVPIFGELSDQEAIDIYKSFEFNVFPLRSENISAQLQGSIHCMTMTYPHIGQV